MNNKAVLTKLFFVFAITFGMGSAQAAVITVNSNLDNVNDEAGAAGAAGVLCTLREAINAANQMSGGNDDCIAGDPHGTGVGNGQTGDNPVNPTDRIVFALPVSTTTVELDNAVLSLPLEIRDRVEIDGDDADGPGVGTADAVIAPKLGVADRFFNIIDKSALNAGEDPNQVTFENLTIKGASGATAAASDSGSAISLIKTDVVPQVLNLTNVTLRDNVNTDSVNDFGGAVSVVGQVHLNISNSRFYKNSAALASGAVMALNSGTNAPTVMIVGSTFGAIGDGNSAPVAGALGFADSASTGSLNVIDSTFIANVASGLTAGGGAIAIQAADQVTIDNSTFGGAAPGEANTSAEDGGAIYFGGTAAVPSPAAAVNILNSRFIGNTAAQSGGAVILSDLGAVANDYPINILNSTFTSNMATGGVFSGGAIEQRDVNYLVTIDSSTLSGNTTVGSGGAILCNQVDGGNDAAADLRILNSTISGNLANISAGGLGVVNGCDVALNNVTITANKADADNAGGGFGGGVLAGIAGSTLLVSNSLIAGNTVGTTGARPDCGFSGFITSGGYNLIGNDSGCSGAFGPATNDQVGTVSMGDPAIDPLLGPLQNNGGETSTHALLPGSPAVDKGNSAIGCMDADAVLLVDDQRGQPRPAAGPANACDVGAFEAQPGPAIVGLAVTGQLGPTDPTPTKGTANNDVMTFTLTGPAGGLNLEELVIAESGPGNAMQSVAGIYATADLDGDATIDGTSNTGVFGAANGSTTLTFAPAVVVAPGQTVVIKVYVNLSNTIVENSMDMTMLVAGLPMIGVLGLFGLGATGGQGRKPLLTMLLVVFTLGLTGCVEALVASSSDDDDDSESEVSQTFNFTVTDVNPADPNTDYQLNPQPTQQIKVKK